MSKMMTTRWPLMLFAQFWLTMGIHGVIDVFIQKQVRDLSLFYIIAGAIGLFFIGAVARFALSEIPYRPDGTISPEFRSTMAPVSGHPQKSPFSFVAELFMVPIVGIPMTEVGFLFEVNDARQYSGILVGVGIFAFAYLADFVYRSISGKYIATNGSTTTKEIES